MIRVIFSLLVLGCGATSTPAPSTCPTGGVPEERGMVNDGHCEVRFEGCCYSQAQDACRAAGCEENCLILESYPGQVDCQ